MIKRVFFVLALGLIFSCYRDHRNGINHKDSVEVFLTVLKSKTFLKGNLVYSDSLYFIKSKFYHKDFPASSDYFKLFYIDDTPQNKSLNFPGRDNDKRERYEITKFSFSNDTANIVLYHPGVRESYRYNLKKIKNSWVIIKENSELY